MPGQYEWDVVERDDGFLLCEELRFLGEPGGGL